MTHRAPKPKLPRTPLPAQRGGVHKVATKVLPRKAKHKTRPADE